MSLSEIKHADFQSERQLVPPIRSDVLRETDGVDWAEAKAGLIRKVFLQTWAIFSYKPFPRRGAL